MPKKQQKIVVIGSTGSLGQTTLNVLREFPENFQIEGLACFQNIQKLHQQILDFKPKFVAVYDIAAGVSLAQKLQKISAKNRPQIFIGPSGWEQIATLKSAHKTLFLSNGTTALDALLSAIKSHKQIALANKEVLVAHGEKIMNTAKKNNVTIVPIDSEHSAIFQCLQGEDPKSIEKIILTCSGGPFFGKNTEQLKNITFADAISHPVWKMGSKISVDSATLMNKGFEVIEAMHLFGLKESQVEVLIHPEGIVHSLVQFTDGSVKAQLSVPDMRFAILYALSYPNRLLASFPRLDLAALNNMHFYSADHQTFPGITLALEALKNRRTHTLVKANETAVQKFADQQIAFLDIYEHIRSELRK